MQFKPVFDCSSSVDHTRYFYQDEFLGEQELVWLNNLKMLYPFEEASIVGDATGVRKSMIKWITPDERSMWVYDRIANMAQIVNKDMWGFELHSVIDSIQYTEYPHGNGHYDWHIDIGPAPINHRKLSVVIQLSDPEEYEGGDLEIWSGASPITIPKKKGNIVIFPSFLMHRVTPVTKGLRKSLVLWLGGNSYK